MSVHKKPDGRWFVTYRDENRKQKYEWFGRGDEAEKNARIRQNEIEKERLEGNKPKAKSALYFDELCQLYVDDRRVNGASARYIHDLLNLLNNHIGPRFVNRTVKSIEYNDIMKVINELWPNPDHNPSRFATQQRYITYLKAIFRFGVKHCKTGHNPLIEWTKSKKKERKLPFHLTVADLEKIIANAEPHLNWALEVEWNLGTRPGPSELFALKWSDVDFEKGTVRVHGSKTKESDRTVPISEEFLDKLQARQKTAKTAYIIEYQGKPIRKLRRSFQTACKNAGINYRVRMYDIRHLFATTMLNKGGDLAAVSKILGHATINQTQEAYYELLAGAKEEAVSLLPKIEVKEKPKKEKKAGKGQAREPEQPESTEPAPNLEITPEEKPSKVVSIESFKKRMLVKAVGQ